MDNPDQYEYFKVKGDWRDLRDVMALIVIAMILYVVLVMGMSYVMDFGSATDCSRSPCGFDTFEVEPR